MHSTSLRLGLDRYLNPIRTGAVHRRVTGQDETMHYRDRCRCLGGDHAAAEEGGEDNPPSIATGQNLIFSYKVYGGENDNAYRALALRL